MQSPLIKKSRPVLPANIKKLLLRAGILFAAWSLLYYAFLQPVGIPDQQLTDIVLRGTMTLLSGFYQNVYQEGNSIFLNGIRSVNIAPQCNGLELMVLYVGFLLIMPATAKRMLAFSVTGVFLIVVLNVLRCALLAWLYLQNVEVADIAHHYIFKLAIYGVVFYCWMLYTRTVTIDAK